MKKIILILGLLTFLIIPAAKAEENMIQNNNQQKPKPTQITFVYINGSNDLSYENRTKFKESFEKDVNNLHPKMIEGFENDAFIKENLLKNGKYKINPSPIIFYWGDRSIKEIQNIDNDLTAAKKYTPKIAQKVRSIFAHCLHDAIWIQKYQNMEPVIDDLQKVVKSETDKGNKVVLLGYSAGSFITYQYFLTKFTSIKPNELAMNDRNTEIEEIISNYPAQPTCLDALLETDLVKLNIYGKFEPNTDIENFQKNYPLLNEKTKNACFLDTDVKGVINFASPLILFYSDVADASTSLNFLSQLMVKNIVENDIFFLTINYRNDPLGFPNAENLTMKKLKTSKSVLAPYFKGGNGFIYNKSDLFVPRTFITAHMSYWKTPERFVKGIVKAYNEGFTIFHEINCEK